MFSGGTDTKSSDSMITLINNLDIGILEVNQDSKITLYNASCLKILDTNQTLTNLKLEQILKFEDLDGKKVNVKQLVFDCHRLEVNDQLIYHYQTGETIRIELTISPIKNNFGVNEQNSYLLMLRDITKAKNLEQQKDEFISITSHELRTPTAIAEGSLSNLELMLDQGKLDQARFRQLVTRAHQQILFLSNMINDLSSLSRAQRQEILEINQINLATLAEDLYHKYQPQAQTQGLDFDLDLRGKLTPIETNSLYLEEILQNFLTNAIKYTETGSVKLIIEQDNVNTVISVQDSGAGISKNEQNKIFDKFYRIEDYRTRETNGTGLGLYVAKSLSNKIGATIRLRSRINFGSTFSLILPRHK